MAINFAGGTDTISYATSGSWPQDGCVSFKMKSTQTTANAVCLSIWNSSSRFGWAFILNNTANKILAHAYGVDGSAVAFSFLSTTSFNDGSWHRIALNYNTANGAPNAFYIDGNLEGSGNSANVWTINSAASPLLLGTQPSFWASYVGDMAELGLWNRQLDTSEIAALAKDFSPARVARNALVFHAPMIRPARDRFGATMTGPTGTTVSDHGRAVYPAF